MKNHSFNNLPTEELDHNEKVYVKPWGYEFLIYQNTKIALWYLSIKQNQGTSLHTHFKKDTQIIVLDGTLELGTSMTTLYFTEFDTIYIPKKTFHSLKSISDSCTLLEVEIFAKDVTYSNKCDVLRINDIYKRENVGYKSSVVETTNSDYFVITSNLDKAVHNTHLSVEQLNNTSKIENTSIYVLLYNTCFSNGLYLSEGSIFKGDDLSIPLTYKDDTCMCLKIKTHENFNNKVIYNESHLKYILQQCGNNKIILTSGCFDILHTGHMVSLREAKKLGDILIVCLSSDEQITYLKGNNRPINKLKDRLSLFTCLPYVDYIIPYDETVPFDKEEKLDHLMKLISPNIWCKGRDYNKIEILKKHPHLQNIKLIELVPNISTTSIVDKINLFKTTE